MSPSVLNSADIEQFLIWEVCTDKRMDIYSRSLFSFVLIFANEMYGFDIFLKKFILFMHISTHLLCV